MPMSQEVVFDPSFVHDSDCIEQRAAASNSTSFTARILPFVKSY